MAAKKEYKESVVGVVDRWTSEDDFQCCGCSDRQVNWGKGAYRSCPELSQLKRKDAFSSFNVTDFM